MIVLVLLCLGFFMLFVMNIYKFKQQEKRFNQKLSLQNKRIFFVNNSDLDIKAECYQPESFFKMHNKGSDPCEQVTDFDFQHHATLEDYYM